VSALAAVRTAKAIHVFSDGAATSVCDDATYGQMMEVRSKQRVANGVVFACCHYLAPTIRFAELAAEQCAGYDDVVQSDRRLFAEALQTPGSWQDEFCGVFYAGWSDRAKRLAMSMTYSDPRTCHRQFWHEYDMPAMAVGPAPPARNLGEAFVKRFTDNPDSFDPRRDGLALIEAMRRHCRCEDEGRSYYAIGGYLQHTTITRDEITTAIIHHWPDELGERIDPKAEVGAVTSAGEAWGAVWRRREEALMERQAAVLLRPCVHLQLAEE
jgi:hypothetical protein